MKHNDIVENQASEDAILIGAAFREAYYRAKRWKKAIWVITTLLCLLQLQSSLWPIATELSQAATFTVLIISMLLVTIGKNRLVDGYVNIGALAQQKWDHRVLGIGVAPGRMELPQSQIADLGSSWLTRRPADKLNLQNWLPACISRAPSSVALAISLRANSAWEAELRKHYHSVLSGGAILVLVLCLLGAGFLEFSIPELMLKILVPVAPLLTLLGEEILNVGQNLKAAENCKRESIRACETILGTCNIKLGDDQIMDLWSEWQRFRKGSTQIFEWFYWASQRRMDHAMVVDAEELVSAYEASRVEKGCID